MLLPSHGLDALVREWCKRHSKLFRRHRESEIEKNSGAEKKSKPQSRVMRQGSGVDTVGLCAEEGTKIFVDGPVSQATFGLEVILP